MVLETLCVTGWYATVGCILVSGRVLAPGPPDFLARLHDEREEEENDEGDRQYTERHCLDPLEDHHDDVGLAAGDRLRVVKRRLDEVCSGDDQQQR